MVCRNTGIKTNLESDKKTFVKFLLKLCGINSK